MTLPLKVNDTNGHFKVPAYYDEGGSNDTVLSQFNLLHQINFQTKLFTTCHFDVHDSSKTYQLSIQII
jgi:hypothetical protein